MKMKVKVEKNRDERHGSGVKEPERSQVIKFDRKIVMMQRAVRSPVTWQTRVNDGCY
jgi:hypothetical protein